MNQKHISNFNFWT